MTLKKTKLTLSCAATVVATLAFFAARADAQRLSESRIQELIRLAAERTGAGQAAPAPGQAAPVPDQSPDPSQKPPSAPAAA